MIQYKLCRYEATEKWLSVLLSECLSDVKTRQKLLSRYHDLMTVYPMCFLYTLRKHSHMIQTVQADCYVLASV